MPLTPAPSWAPPPSFPYLPWRKCTLAPHLLPAMGEVHSEEERLILAWDLLRGNHQQVADPGGPCRLQLGSLGGGQSQTNRFQGPKDPAPTPGIPGPPGIPIPSASASLDLN